MKISPDKEAIMDLCGKLIIKAQLKDDIRRVPIHNEDMTYDELVLMMQRVFRSSLDPNEDLLIKYKDEDGDLVTIFDTSDLSFAIQTNRVLRLTLLTGEDASRPVTSKNLSEYNVREYLRSIRDNVIAMLDAFDLKTPHVATEEKVDTKNLEVTSHASQSIQGTLAADPPKEFDPLQRQQQIKSLETDTGASGDSRGTPSMTPENKHSPGISSSTSVASPSHIPPQPQSMQHYPSFSQSYSESQPPVITPSLIGGTIRPMAASHTRYPYPYPQNMAGAASNPYFKNGSMPPTTFPNMAPYGIPQTNSPNPMAPATFNQPYPYKFQ